MLLKAAYIPNLICIGRILLVWPILLNLLEEHYVAALLLICIAGLSDGLDGFLAKRFDWRTRLGGLLDPLADKLLLVVVMLSLTSLGLVPLWLAAVVIGRDIVIVSGALAYNQLIGPVRPAPTLVSKINTLLQLFYVFVVIAGQIVDWPLAVVELLAGTGVFCTSVVSGLDYVIQWSRKARAGRQA